MRRIEATISSGFVPFNGINPPRAIWGCTPNLAIALLGDAVPGRQAPTVQDDADSTRMEVYRRLLRIKGQDIPPVPLLERDRGDVHGLGREAFLHPGPDTVITV